jgi:hypothetical protein
MANADEERADRVLGHPEEWVTGEEPWTAAQRAYLQTLAKEVGAEVPDEMTKAEASRLIDELREQSGLE